MPDEDLLEGREPLILERTFELSAPVGTAAFTRLVEAFANSLVREPHRTLRATNETVMAGIRRSYAVTDAEGKFTCESLAQLAQHLGRRRIEQFAVRLSARWDSRMLLARTSGTRVTVKSGAWTRDAAVRGIEAAVVALRLASPGGSTGERTSRTGKAALRYDAFISHASEDKSAVALPLRNALVRRGYSVWLDVFKIKVGDSLRESIDEGLRRSRHGIVILSPSFFGKRKVWTHAELDGLFSQEQVIRRRTILPVLHRLSVSELAGRSPILASRLAADYDDGLEAVVRELVSSMGVPLKRRRDD